ncbi:hypothetical protein [Nocardia sp. NPDC059228]|uniref:hypothetical protein n=1 Tax=Nocardia sp. NPDC059228 TaxID=3346777 RepID=UPI0036C1048E
MILLTAERLGLISPAIGVGVRPSAKLRTRTLAMFSQLRSPRATASRSHNDLGARRGAEVAALPGQGVGTGKPMLCRLDVLHRAIVLHIEQHSLRNLVKILNAEGLPTAKSHAVCEIDRGWHGGGIG